MGKFPHEVAEGLTTTEAGKILACRKIKADLEERARKKSRTKSSMVPQAPRTGRPRPIGTRRR